jgi:hypothetical protein
MALNWRSPLRIFSSVAADGDYCDDDAIPLIAFLSVGLSSEASFHRR